MKQRNRSAVVKELDKVFSLYIRKRNADEDGMVECYTCGRPYEVKTIQCGHFMTRAKYSTRWDEDNARPQCFGCNVMQQGKQYLFGINLNKEEDGLAERVNIRSRKSMKFSTPELEQMIIDYKQKLEL